MNSRPLCALSDVPFNLTYLSPGHFLIGEPLTQIPAGDFTDVKYNRLSRWRTYQQQLQQFWQRWSSDYLQSLQQLQRWQRSSPNLQPGDLVLLRVDNTAPIHWPTAVDTDKHPGKDGIVQVATIRSSNGVFKRPIIKICPLPRVNSELQCYCFWGWQYVTLRAEFLQLDFLANNMRNIGAVIAQLVTVWNDAIITRYVMSSRV